MQWHVIERNTLSAIITTVRGGEEMDLQYQKGKTPISKIRLHFHHLNQAAFCNKGKEELWLWRVREMLHNYASGPLLHTHRPHLLQIIGILFHTHSGFNLSSVVHYQSICQRSATQELCRTELQCWRCFSVYSCETGFVCFLAGVCVYPLLHPGSVALETPAIHSWSSMHAQHCDLPLRDKNGFQGSRGAH